MKKWSGPLFWILILSIVAIVLVQIISETNTDKFYNTMDTIVKIALGAWGGASISEGK